ncbi:MAG: 3-phosphoshikimate 1-carboxyvinyltransferase [Christensenellales bacterium]|jgi:3-phosphoshikimate 1-carboxyvinyltransferase
MDVKILPSRLQGNITVPPSKSAAHRAIIAAALAKGHSTIKNVDLSSDILATIGACRSLGCTIHIGNSHKYRTLEIKGGLHISGSANIDCAESGSTLRFFIPIACALEGKKIFTGKGRLPKRPIDAYFDIFDKEGILYKKPALSSLPLSVSGTLAGGDYVVEGSISSQYITGLLLALPTLDKDTSIAVVNGFESKGYVDLTIRILQQFGIDIVCSDSHYTIKGNQAYKPQNYTIEGDYSQAAFFIAGGALTGDICIDGLSRVSLQPDSAIIDIMKRMGAKVDWDQSTLRVKKSYLTGIDIDVSQCPDLVPPLAVAAAFADGKTRITGASRLRIKESDRLNAISVNLNALGVKTQERPDGLIIQGAEIAQGDVSSFGDHRIAMAFSIAALRTQGGIRIKGAECINKSYPGFLKDLASLGGRI